MLHPTGTVEPGAVGLDGACARMQVWAAQEALGLCPPPWVLPHLHVDEPGAVLHQGKEAAKAESQEMLEMGICLLAEGFQGNVGVSQALWERPMTSFGV